MNVLVINAGSMSVKFLLFNAETHNVLAECHSKGVGQPSVQTVYKWNGKEHKDHEPVHDALSAVEWFLQLATTGETKVIDTMDDIAAISHRVAMVGEKYGGVTLVDDELMEDIELHAKFVPLHNPPQLRVIRACQEIFGKDKPQTAGFDTGFHTGMPRKGYTLPIPYEYEEKYGMRKYGFHGLSMQYLMRRYNELTEGAGENQKIVACHLGGGASINPIANGQSVGTAFGVGIGQGAMSSTRSGTFDHTAVTFLMEHVGMSFPEISRMLLTESGLLGISGVSQDVQILEQAAADGHQRAALALEVMASQIRQYIGGFAFEMGELDAVIFAGGIGENSSHMRQLMIGGLEKFGLVLDQEKNQKCHGQEMCISTKDSPRAIWVIPTNEERVLLDETVALLRKNP